MISGSVFMDLFIGWLLDGIIDDTGVHLLLAWLFWHPICTCIRITLLEWIDRSDLLCLLAISILYTGTLKARILLKWTSSCPSDIVKILLILANYSNTCQTLLLIRGSLGLCRMIEWWDALKRSSRGVWHWSNISMIVLFFVHLLRVPT